MSRTAIRLVSVCFALVLALPALAQEKPTPNGPRLAYVSVVGAPGDGEEALAAAMTRRLGSIGMQPATAFQGEVYEIQGTVKVAPARGGKQSVRILWVVLDPYGKQLGVISQIKQVRKGSLDRKWGAAAEAAAGAAIGEIAELLPN